LEILEHLREKLADIFKNLFVEIQIIDTIEEIPANSYDQARNQYLSPLFMVAIRNYAEEYGFSKVLGITAFDLFIYELNFVFGQAEFGSEARAAVISLCRLYPEFYRQESNKDLFLIRSVKEGIHEIGHTFGLKHCKNNCIMVFSNNLMDTDKKPAAFCDRCQKKLFGKD